MFNHEKNFADAGDFTTDLVILIAFCHEFQFFQKKKSLGLRKRKDYANHRFVFETYWPL